MHKKTMKFEIKKDSRGQYYWVFKSSNGQVICVTESYVSKEGAKHSIDIMKTYASGASVLDLA